MKKIIFVSLVAFLFLEVTNLYSMDEFKKIEILLMKIEKSDYIFIRNGKEHSAKEAVSHLRLKISKAGSRLKTAREFIKFIATGSSLPWGDDYYLKLKNGKKIKSAKWLTKELLIIEKQP